MDQQLTPEEWTEKHPIGSTVTMDDATATVETPAYWYRQPSRGIERVEVVVRPEGRRSRGVPVNRLA